MRYGNLPTGAFWKFPDGSGLYQKRADGDYEVKTGKTLVKELDDAVVVLCGADGSDTVPYSSIPVGGWWAFAKGDGAFQKRSDGDYIGGERFDHEAPGTLVVPCDDETDDETADETDDETADATDDATEDATEDATDDVPQRTFDDVPLGEPFSIGDRDFIRTSVALTRTVACDTIVNAWCVTLRQFARVDAAQPVE